ncbi:hypothetical protein D9758_000627 [Tetrapyrgos nigripes]|uniref:Uncharacterized protein n=1 Tax=Tetrapyrgos nigripes TaxID=182062 RepID=A0A8H5LY51_9AGAR|nr:hypothetical protein D9758_000627 [Tetrapyrgos nigripes]
MEVAMSALGWSLSPSASGSRQYERKLGLNELGFYYDSRFSGTADTLQNTLIETASSKLFGRERVQKAWVAIKQQFPLLGASLKEVSKDQVYFVVDEISLGSCNLGDVVYRSCSSEEEVREFVQVVVNGPRILSNDRLACLFIIQRTDKPAYFHTVVHVAHCITDGMSNISILSTLLSYLSKGVPANEPSLENQLGLSIASETLRSDLKGSLAKRRWHRAMGKVLLQIRNMKRTGGHTLPRTWTTKSMETPAQSALIADSFSVEQSQIVMANCRKYGMTFGNAYPVIAQVAMTRVLCRRYLNGQMDKEEWEFRKRQPMMSAGPLNLRPYLDERWYRDAGNAHVLLCIDFFTFVLPFMSLGPAANLVVGDALPAFDALLSHNRFLLRCNIIKKQSADLFKNPRFLDLGLAYLPGRIERTRTSAIRWLEGADHHEEEKLSPQEQVKLGPVLGHGGSSMGNIDLLLPRDYPAGSGESQLHIHYSATHLRCRPGELYLGAATSRQQLRLNIYWDLNVYDKALVEEWFFDVKDAVRHYLGRGTDIRDAKL